jgi:16S rRNA (guanine966-N2)-methyltransferase
MRLAVLNILGAEALAGASVLDLYAGTGASGIEALSRGARRAVFVESARPALEALARNLETLGLGREEGLVRPGDAVRILRAGPSLPFEPFDLVLCDPPYELFRDPRAAAGLREALGALVARGGLAPGGTLVAEHPGERAFGPAPAGLVLTDRRRYSAAGVSFFRLPAPFADPSVSSNPS